MPNWFRFRFEVSGSGALSGDLWGMGQTWTCPNTGMVHAEDGTEVLIRPQVVNNQSPNKDCLDESVSVHLDICGSKLRIDGHGNIREK